MSAPSSRPEPPPRLLPPAVLGPFVVGIAWVGCVAKAYGVGTGSTPLSLQGTGAMTMVSTALMVVLLASTGFAAGHDDTRLRRVNAVAILGWGAAMLLARIGGLELPVDTAAHPGYVWLLLGVCGLAFFGLARRQRWARWLAIGLGAAASMSSGLNAIQEWFAVPGLRLWLLGTSAAAAALLIVNLASASMAEADARAGDSVWDRRDPVVFWLRAAVVSSFVAVPMLLVYAWVQAGRIDALTTPAVVLAAWLTGSTVLTVRGRVVGALMLALGGGALLVLGASLLSYATVAFDRAVAGYYLAFWGPAGVCAIAAGVKLGGPIWRALRRDDDA